MIFQIISAKVYGVHLLKCLRKEKLRYSILRWLKLSIWTITPDPGIRKHTPRLACLIWDVVTRSVLDTGMSLLTFLGRNQQRHPSVQHGTSNDIPESYTTEIRHAKRGVCFLIPGSGVIVHILAAEKEDITIKKRHNSSYDQKGHRFWNTGKEK